MLSDGRIVESTWKLWRSLQVGCFQYRDPQFESSHHNIFIEKILNYLHQARA